MNPKITQPWIPVAKVQELVQLEPALVVAGLAIGAWLAYKILLRNVSQERHRNLRGQFKRLSAYMVFASALFGAYYGLSGIHEHMEWLERLTSYIGLLALLAGAVIFVKVWRILVFEYLFLSHMKVAVPVLLVNLFTLALSIVIAGWFVSELFGVRLTPLLATSAVLSIVVGLAMQDTLGNLFAGVALQFDKPYEIGDWIEGQNGIQKWVGQIQEISWRATVLVGLADESLTVPNRVMSQAQITNYSTKDRPIARSLLFRLPYGAPIAQVKEILTFAAMATPGVRKDPLPVVYLSETGESWLAFKLVYFLDDFSKQFSINDKLMSTALEGFGRAGIKLAVPSLAIPELRHAILEGTSE